MKKFLAAVLSCAMIVTAVMGLAVTASAEAAPVTFTVQSVEAKAGDIITVDVSVSENHYMVNGQLWIDYDPTMLEIQEVWEDEDNPYFEEINTKIFKSTYMWAFGAETPGTAKFAFASSSSKGTTAGGVMFTLTFKVLEGATDTTITLYTYDGDMYSSDGVTNNGEDYATNVEFVNGNVTVAQEEPAFVKGDTNGDGAVTLADAMQAFYHVNEKIVLKDDAIQRADVNGDGTVALADAMKIFYFVNERISAL